jgi:hypothetical protein
VNDIKALYKRNKSYEIFTSKEHLILNGHTALA